MTKSTRSYVFDGLELLPKNLIAFVEKRLQTAFKSEWREKVIACHSQLGLRDDGKLNWDQASLLKVMKKYWREAFGDVLGANERSIVFELADVRNKFSHNQQFSYDDSERALDNVRRLLLAVNAADAADEATGMRNEILRIRFKDLARNEERKKAQDLDAAIKPVAGLLSWREVIMPHDDVAAGEFQNAEFAADLAKTHNGSAASEYRDPGEFFARTYLTDGLIKILVQAAKRLANEGADPVVELQTNFGGGKTHTLLALYHMVTAKNPNELPGLDQLIKSKGLNLPPNIKCAVLVGTSRGPTDILHQDGLEIRTSWGEMAYQLGGKNAYAILQDCDQKGIAPGSELLEKLFKANSPCLILIDEWVAYLRQIYRKDALPSGSFDANLSFVQSLTEAIKASPQSLLVASLPASQIEVGGEGGQEALTRLKQTFGRLGSAWLPASQEESYEIVRRRLFKEITGQKAHHKDNTINQFMKFYKANSDVFPQNAKDEDYRRKMEKSYPIHPELFDQLYAAWGAIEKFQRTRGVLRFMAQTVHELWMANDPSIMIMPASIPLNSPRVQPELCNYLPQGWPNIIDSDIDGPQSTPYRIDKETPSLNRHAATRRVARTLFMGTSPESGVQNKGLDDRQINLGVLQPGEKPSIFGDALRRLANQAKYIHNDLGRYWYSTAPNLNRIAAEKADKIESEMVTDTINRFLTQYIKDIGRERADFDSVHCAPDSSADIVDELGGIRAVILNVKHPYINGRKPSPSSSPAANEIQKILKSRGSAPRIYRNNLIFIAADARTIDALGQAVRQYLAWADIVAETKARDLTQSESARAQAQCDQAKSTLETRLREAWCWLIYPSQSNPKSDIELIHNKLTSNHSLLTQACNKLRVENALLGELGPVNLQQNLEKYIWQDKPHIHMQKLWEYLNCLVYLPRLKNREVLIKSVLSAIANITPGPFAYAEKYDEANSTYQGLAIEQASNTQVTIDNNAVIVRANVAFDHRPTPTPTEDNPAATPLLSAKHPQASLQEPKPTQAKTEPLPTRFRASALISPKRPNKDMQEIVENLIQHLTEIPEAAVEIKLEIDAEASKGIDKNKARILNENAKTLKLFDIDLT